MTPVISETFYTRFFHISLLALLVMLCYSNTLNAPWHFDDFGNIVDTSSIRIKELSLTELHKVVHRDMHDRGSNNRPVASLTFALNYLFSGYDTTSYHVVNICLHLMTAWLVYLVFWRTMDLYNKNNAATDSSDRYVSRSDIALLGSVFWALHPIHTQAVTYIVQRQTVLAAMFFMLAMHCYIRARLSKGLLLSIVWILFLLIFYLLGIGSKQNTALLPLSLIGFEIAFFRFSFSRSFQTNRAMQVFSLASLISMLLLLWLKGRSVFDYFLQVYVYRPFTLWERLITEPIILFKYIFLLLVPLSDFLTLEADIIASRSLVDPPYTLLAVFAITCLGLFSIFLLKRQPVIGFAIFFFFANHIVESTFIPVELYFEHRNYVPSIFVYLAISFLFIKIFSFYQKRRSIFMQFVIILLCISILISEGNATYLRNDIWGDEIALMEDSIKKSPGNIRPYISISSMYAKLKMFDKAKGYLKKAESLYKTNPDRYQANLPALLYYNASVLYSHDWSGRDIDKAIALLYKSCEIYPGDYLQHMTLGALLFEKGEFQEAEKAMVNASALNNDLSSVFYSNFGRILYSNGKTDEAVDAFLSGLGIERTDELRLNLVAAYLKKGNSVKAKYILDEMSKNSNAPAYLLSYALLNSGPEGDSALEKLAGLLVDNGVSYPEWIEKIYKNNLLGILYPNIDSIEPILKSKFLDKFKNIRDEAEKAIVKTQGSNTSSVKLLLGKSS